MAFLKAQGGHTWACDWLRVKTISFRTLYVFVVMAHERRRVVHFRITDQPSDVWVAQQIVLRKYSSAPLKGTTGGVRYS